MTTYWEGNGKYQDQATALQALIPDEGKAADPSIELSRCISNIYYDCYNNGGCNLDRRLDEIHYIIRYKDQIVARVGEEAWNGFKKTVVSFANRLAESNERISYDGEDDDRIIELGKNWEEPLELVTDAIILIASVNIMSQGMKPNASF